MIHRSERYAPSRPEYNKIYKLHLPNPRPTESACGHDAFVRDSSVALHACFHSERTHRYLERYAPSRPEYNKIYELHLPNRQPAESVCRHDAFVRDVFVRNTIVRSTFVRNSLGALRACFHSERTHRYPERYASSRSEYNKIYELYLPNRRPTESACGHDACARDVFVCNVFVRNTLVRSTFVRNSLGALHACFHSERTHRYPERYAPSRPEYNKIYELHLPNRQPAESVCRHDAFVRSGSTALHVPPILQAAASPCFFFK
ncbi:MAG: hypothetical protein V8Q31_03200 [Alistipes communis]